MAVGSLIVREVGEVISDRHGHPFDLFRRSIVAVTPAIHVSLVWLLSPDS